MHYDTPTKFAARSSGAGATPGNAANLEHRRRVGIDEHKRFERDAKVLFDEGMVSKRNTVNVHFIRLFFFLTVAGATVLFILT